MWTLDAFMFLGAVTGVLKISNIRCWILSMKILPPPTMGLGLGVDRYPYLCWGFDDNPGSNNIDRCRDCIQTSDIPLQVCLSSFWLPGSGRMRILSLCAKRPWWSLIRLSKFLLMERNCSTCLKTWSGIASS